MKLTEDIEVFNMDCMEYMKGIPDKHFPLCICDPPFGINADKKNSVKKLQSKKSSALSKNYGVQSWDSNIPSFEYFKEIKRVSKHQIIWGVNYYPYEILIGGRIFWDKCVTMPTYSDGELAYCSLINSVKIYKYAWHGMIQQDMKNKEIRIHPTQKPIALYKWLLHNYAKEGDTIFDSHLGSGSSMIAAHEYGFKFVGCEIDQDYFNASVKRFKEQTAQQSLFKT